jgi:hypothetical protein
LIHVEGPMWAVSQTGIAALAAAVLTRSRRSASRSDMEVQR